MMNLFNKHILIAYLNFRLWLMVNNVLAHYNFEFLDLQKNRSYHEMQCKDDVPELKQCHLS